MIRFVISKIVEEIVNSSPNKGYVDTLPDDLKRAYKDDDNDGTINYLDKDVDLETRAKWREQFMEHNSKLGNANKSWDNSRQDSLYNNEDVSRGLDIVRGGVFVVVIGYIIITLILKS